jgi:hypothetical protein
MEAPEKNRSNRSEAGWTSNMRSGEKRRIGSKVFPLVLSLCPLRVANVAKVRPFSHISEPKIQSLSALETAWRREVNSNSEYAFCNRRDSAALAPPCRGWTEWKVLAACLQRYDATSFNMVRSNQESNFKFEFISLRHAVSTAEKFCYVGLEKRDKAIGLGFFSSKEGVTAPHYEAIRSISS